ncbi:hypothetical protein H310_01597 [Aphanomyces invadans]|uniref:Methyltransferase type 11 domain-containing protein n=1 Tax=Aphanomyces invadans TaxID=157072 RepID=A0A024UT80_9STRA|nr:hypothetical protein H310_01597 [Aphanomyces invadans]ETW09165.1 hypothetical protein H310_01597 [Aphanomyces invadans]|eukprot:XP_008862970.1 hypothetical protein H310_01597 [Aphanomyces invadans]
MVVELNAWDPTQYNRAAGFVAREFGESLVEVLRPQPNETILDLGCGDGAVTAKIAATGASVIGVDSSEPMVSHARAHFGLDARVMDGQALTFDNGEVFDAVFSNAALHWMPNTEGILSSVASVLRPGGRFVVECGGFGNIASIVTAIVAVLARHGIDGRSKIPWTFRTATEWEAHLTNARFRVKSIASYSRQPVLPDGIVGWLKTFGDNFFDELPVDKREEAMHDIQDLLKWSLCDREGLWRADYIRLRFEAIKE